ncbi:ABC transporter permease [Rubellimicrobium roseum]|uniref:Transport permease protein n=1 Tax=Rubellimicrobium roseum TaxID=687525 RepID=A0A5C4NDP8_9RHOB|nr:ABC transporter permease [Rubellimicrobium roseum]TNC71448.1 ABC transporter permease [Rubellimicrobium roseum]
MRPLGPSADLRRKFELLFELVLRDLRIRYMRSYLGIGWSLLNPLSQIAIFSFLFRQVMPLDIPSYTAFVFCGVLSWTWFSSSLISSAGAVVASPELIRRPGFPVTVLPTLSVITNMVQFLLALPLLLLLTVVDGGRLGAALLALPLVMATQYVLTLSLCFPVAALNVRFRDTQHVVGLVMMALFYMTPIFYSVDAVPEEYLFLYEMNPMVTVVDAYRDILIRNEAPDLGALLVVLLLSIPIALLGRALFLRESARFAEEL